MKRSFIREILEHTNNEIISFAGGLLDSNFFPTEGLRESANRVLSLQNTLQYIQSAGLKALRGKIANIYTKEGLKSTHENIIITSGSQQALDIIARYYNNKIRGVTVEEPSYLGAMNIFQLNNLSQFPVSLNFNGIEIKQFEKNFKQTKFGYLIPDYQNPTGSLYSQKCREEIAHIVKKHDGLLIEDTPYSQIFFKKKSKNISSLIPNNSFLLGSFSKTLAPSFRIGWIRANVELLKPLIGCKETMDLHSNGISQYILNDFLSQNNFYETHLNTLRKVYLKKMEIFCDALDKYLPTFKYKKPNGGMFVYGELNKNINSMSLVKKCLKKGVIFVPGEEFYNKNKKFNEIRFNFTNSNEKEIIKGLKIISETIG